MLAWPFEVVATGFGLEKSRGAAIGEQNERTGDDVAHRIFRLHDDGAGNVLPTMADCLRRNRGDASYCATTSLSVKVAVA